MKNRYVIFVTFTVMTVFVIFLYSVSIAQTEKDSKDIPITTKSEKALKSFLLGRDLFELQKTEEAEQFFKEAVHEDSNFCFAYYYLAHCANSLPKFREYIDKADAFKKFASKGEQILVDISWTGLDRNMEKALSLAQELVRIYPRSPRAYLTLAAQLFGMDQIEEGRNTILKAISIDTTFAFSYLIIAYSYLQSAPIDYSKAEKYVSKFARIIPNEPLGYIALGDAYRVKNNLVSAKDNYNKAIEIDPDYFYPYEKRGYVNIISGNYDDARNDFLKAQKFVKVPTFNLNIVYGYSYLFEGKIDEALGYYSELMENFNKLNLPEDEINLSKYWIYWLIAYIAIENDRLEISEKAIADSKEFAIAVGKESKSKDFEKLVESDLVYMEGLLEIKKGNYKNAIELAKKYADLRKDENNPQKMEYYNTLMGMIELGKGNNNEAVKYFEKANIQEDLYDKYYYALALIGAKKNDKAKKILQEIADNNFIEINSALVKNKAIKKLSEFK